MGFSFPSALGDITSTVTHMLTHIYNFTDGIEAKTNNLPPDPASNTVVNTRASQTSVDNLQTTLNGVQDNVDNLDVPVSSRASQNSLTDITVHQYELRDLGVQHKSFDDSENGFLDVYLTCSEAFTVTSFLVTTDSLNNDDGFRVFAFRTDPTADGLGVNYLAGPEANGILFHYDLIAVVGTPITVPANYQLHAIIHQTETDEGIDTLYSRAMVEVPRIADCSFT